MRAFFTILLLVIPSLVLSQNVPQNFSLNTGGGESFSADPFARQLLQADNPCINGSTWGPAEEAAREVPETCQDYKKLVEGAMATSVEAGDEQPVNLRPYYLLAGTTTVISIIFIVAI